MILPGGGRRRGAAATAPGGVRLAGVLLAAGLAGCGAAAVGAGRDAVVPAGAHLFGAQRPQWAACDRVDTDELSRISTIEVPAGTPDLVDADAGPGQAWAQCVGLTQPAMAADGTVTPPAVVWVVMFATSPRAAAPPGPAPADRSQSTVRSLVRPVRLGDARGEVTMDVRADTHETTVVVTVLDPGTGAPAARCAVAKAHGDEADNAARWCLASMARLLGRPWPTPPPPSPTPSVSPSGSPSPSGAPSVSGSPSASPSVSGSPSGSVVPSVTVATPPPAPPSPSATA